MTGRLGAALISLIVLNSCTNMKPTDFSESTPSLLIEKYFAGETRAWGIFEDRFGTLRRHETDRRVWTITKTGPHTYEGRADDVVGVASGEAYGNALNWRYHMDLKVGDGTMRVHFNDWMFLQPSGVLLNRARVTKFGLAVGEVTLAFFRPETAGEMTSEFISEPTVAALATQAANR
jgi:hypothetical protein